MRINEVEALVGITKKNIRFYEAEGLLSPRRNSENGYRDYGETEVTVLRQIKLLRKLGVSLEEIRQMQQGAHTVGDGMRRHLVTLERERENLNQAIRLCGELKDCPRHLEDLDAGALLARMETLEESGTTFQNKQRSDIRRQYVAPAVIALTSSLLLAAVVGVLLWAFLHSPPEGPLWPLVLVLIFLPVPMMAGILAAFIQRVREIGKGEMDDAKNY